MVCIDVLVFQKFVSTQLQVWLMLDSQSLYRLLCSVVCPLENPCKAWACPWVLVPSVRKKFNLSFHYNQWMWGCIWESLYSLRLSDCQDILLLLSHTLSVQPRDLVALEDIDCHIAGASQSDTFLHWANFLLNKVSSYLSLFLANWANWVSWTHGCLSGFWHGVLTPHILPPWAQEWSMPTKFQCGQVLKFFSHFFLILWILTVLNNPTRH